MVAISSAFPSKAVQSFSFIGTAGVFVAELPHSPQPIYAKYLRVTRIYLTYQFSTLISLGHFESIHFIAFIVPVHLVKIARNCGQKIFDWHYKLRWNPSYFWIPIDDESTYVRTLHFNGIFVAKQYS